MSDHVVTAILRNFSSSNNDSEWEFYKDDRYSRTRSVKFWYVPLFYADGNCKENNGYVSIIFEHMREYLSYEIFRDQEVRCHVSVVDVTGNKRFTQSVVCVYDSINPDDIDESFFFGLERYLKRETLLSDPDELLPGDCLTVCVEVDVINSEQISGDYLYNNDTPFSRDELDGLWISLDTSFGTDLCRVSKFFRCASGTTFMESRTRQVRIQKEEKNAFMLIFYIFNGSELTMTIADIWDMYRVADKYDIQLVIETCRQFVKAVLRMSENPERPQYVDECVPEILEYADYYKDDDMKDAVETYLESKKNFRTNVHALRQHLKEKLHTEWKCEFEETSNSVTHFFTMKRIVVTTFEFYQ